MSSRQWESSLVKYFTTIQSFDTEIESLRSSLCEISSFVPSALFSLLDTDSQNFLSLKDFLLFLKKHYVNFEEKFLRKMIHNFDKDNDFAINYEEFLQICLTKKNKSLRSEVEERKEKENKDANEIENIFAKIISKELDMIKELAQIANELKTSKDFTTYEAFTAIVNEDKYITESNLKNFLINKADDITTLMYRIDSDNDGKISYEEFQEIFFPYKDCISVINEEPKQKSHQVTQSNVSSYKYNEYKSKYGLSSRSDIDDDKMNQTMRTSINKNDMTVSDKTRRIISQSSLIYDYSSNKNLESSIIASERCKSSPRRPVKDNSDVQYRARLTTYTSPMRSIEQPQQCYTVSPCRRTQSPCYHRSCCCVSQQRKKNLFNLFNDIITTESKIESIKEALAFCTDANLSDLFAFFDYSQRDSISIIDMSESLKDLGVYMSMIDLKLLFRRNDKNLDGRFDYKEFCDMILPKKYSIAKLISERYPPLHFTGFSYDTKSKLIDMFNAMVSAEKSNDNYRTILSTSPSTSAFDCFNMLKKDYCYGIYKDDIVNFMEENGKFMNSYEIESLIERLDKNQDGLISYNEFLAEVSPKH